MWPWKKKKKEEPRDDDLKEPTEDEIMLREMERTLDRLMPGMGKMFRMLTEEIEEMMAAPPRGSQHAFKGIRIVIGPDGTPRIEEFGNIRKTPGGKPTVSEYREPLTDVYEGEDEYTITVELPGVDRKDIRVSVDGKIVEIVAEGEGPFKYRKAIGLSSFVDPKTSKARFNNGILEIVAKKAGKPKRGVIELEGMDKEKD